MREFIVAEISKSWPQTNPDMIVKNHPGGYVMPEAIAERFEDVIATNSERGYDLFNWQFTSVVRSMPSDCKSSNLKDIHIETIIAVFRKRSS